MTFTSHWKIISTNLNNGNFCNSIAGELLAVLFISVCIHCNTLVIDKYKNTIYNHIKHVVFVCILLSIEKRSVKRRPR